MKDLLNYITENPWIVFVVLGIAFYLNMLRLIIMEKRRKHAHKTLRIMEDSGFLAKVFLDVKNGKGVFYDIHIKMGDNVETEDLPLRLNNQVLTPALLLMEGDYTIVFKIKVHEFPTGYVRGIGPFACKIKVHQNEDSMLVFDADTLLGYQEAI